MKKSLWWLMMLALVVPVLAQEPVKSLEDLKAEQDDKRDINNDTRTAGIVVMILALVALFAAAMIIVRNTV